MSPGYRPGRQHDVALRVTSNPRALPDREGTPDAETGDDDKVRPTNAG
jgi:hypothetical protein